MRTIAVTLYNHRNKNDIAESINRWLSDHPGSSIMSIFNLGDGYFLLVFQEPATPIEDEIPNMLSDLL